MVRRLFILLISTHFLFSCRTSELFFPLANGKVQKYNDGERISKVVMSQILHVRNDYIVKACENGIVENVLMIGKNFVVIINGRYNIWYSNLSTCGVKKGDKICKESIIGTIPESGYENTDAYLELIIKKDDNYYSTKYFWNK